MTSQPSVAPAARNQPSIAGSTVAPSVSMLCTSSVRKLRPRGEQAREDAVLQEIRDFEPMADGVQALARQIVGVVAALARLPGPRRQRGPHALAHLLLLLVEPLLRRLLPGEVQVAYRGHKPQADGTPGREPDRAAERRADRLAKETLDRRVREVAGREDVRNVRAEKARRTLRLREMHLDEAPVAAAEFCERMQALHHAGSLGPAAAHACRIGHHRHLARPQRGLAPLRAGSADAAVPVRTMPRRERRRSLCSAAAGSLPGRCVRCAGRRGSAHAGRGRIRSRRAARRAVRRPARRAVEGSMRSSSVGSTAAYSGWRRAAWVNCCRSPRSRGVRLRASWRRHRGTDCW